MVLIVNHVNGEQMLGTNFLIAKTQSCPDENGDRIVHGYRFIMNFVMIMAELIGML